MDNNACRSCTICTLVGCSTVLCACALDIVHAVFLSTVFILCISSADSAQTNTTICESCRYHPAVAFTFIGIALENTLYYSYFCHFAWVFVILSFWYLIPFAPGQLCSMTSSDFVQIFIEQIISQESLHSEMWVICLREIIRNTKPYAKPQFSSAGHPPQTPSHIRTIRTICDWQAISLLLDTQ